MPARKPRAGESMPVQAMIPDVDQPVPDRSNRDTPTAFPGRRSEETGPSIVPQNSYAVSTCAESPRMLPRIRAAVMAMGREASSKRAGGFIPPGRFGRIGSTKGSVISMPPGLCSWWNDGPNPKPRPSTGNHRFRAEPDKKYPPNRLFCEIPAFESESAPIKSVNLPGC